MPATTRDPAPDTRCTAFRGAERLAQGTLSTVAAAALAAGDGVLVFDDATGRIIDLDPSDWERRAAPRRKPGRPKLGVVPREVTLLQRHWDWLAQQRGGASATLRRLVDEARKADDGGIAARDAAYRVIHALAGDLPGFEESSRALFAGDMDRFAERMQDWPVDLRTYALQVATGGADRFDAPGSAGPT